MSFWIFRSPKRGSKTVDPQWNTPVKSFGFYFRSWYKKSTLKTPRIKKYFESRHEKQLIAYFGIFSFSEVWTKTRNEIFLNLTFLHYCKIFDENLMENLEIVVMAKRKLESWNVSILINFFFEFLDYEDSNSGINQTVFLLNLPRLKSCFRLRFYRPNHTFSYQETSVPEATCSKIRKTFGQNLDYQVTDTKNRINSFQENRWAQYEDYQLRTR